MKYIGVTIGNDLILVSLSTREGKANLDTDTQTIPNHPKPSQTSSVLCFFNFSLCRSEAVACFLIFRFVSVMPEATASIAACCCRRKGLIAFVIALCMLSTSTLATSCTPLRAPPRRAPRPRYFQGSTRRSSRPCPPAPPPPGPWRRGRRWRSRRWPPRARAQCARGA